MAHLLDITTKRTRQTVKIDGVAYELVEPSDLPMAVQMRVARCAQRYSDIDETKIGSMTVEQMEELGDDLRASAFATFVNISADVFDLLTDEQCIAVISCFKAAPATKKNAPNSRTSKRSPASKGSTAAARKSGAA